MNIFIRPPLLAVVFCMLLPATGNAQATQTELQDWIMDGLDHDVDESLVGLEVNRILLARAKIRPIAADLRIVLREEQRREAFQLAIDEAHSAVDVALRAPDNETDNEEALASDVEVLAWSEESGATEFNYPDIPNLIYEPSRLHDGHFRHAVECINPPEKLRAAYSVAIIDGSSLRGALSDSEYLTDFMALAAPASIHRERHGVRVLINIDSGEWEYFLEGEWGDRDLLRQHLGQQLVGRSMETGPNDAHLGVCRIVQLFEDLLEEGNGDLDHFFEGRQLKAEIASIRQHLQRARSDVWDTDIYPIDREAPFFKEDFTPVFQEASRAWTRAAQAHADGQADEAREAIDEADELIEAVREIGDSVVSYRVDRHQFDMRLASLQEHRQALVKSGLNDDAAIQLYDELSQCQDHLHALHTGLSHGLRLADIESSHAQLELCLEKSEKLIIPLLEEHEANRSKMTLLYLLGAGLLFAMIVRAFLSLHARKRPDFEVENIVDPWQKRSRELSKETEQLPIEFPEIFADNDPAQTRRILNATAREEINRTFMLSNKAEELANKASVIVANRRLSKSETLERIRAIFERENTTLSPDDSIGLVPFGERLQGWHTVSNTRLLTELEELIQRSKKHLEKARQKLEETNADKPDDDSGWQSTEGW